jgi:basic membrane protein A
MTQRRRQFIRALGAAGVVGLAGCSGGDGGDSSDGGDGGGGGSDGGGATATDSGTSTDSGSDTVRAAYVYNGPVGDQGWVASHEAARQQLQDSLDWYETEMVSEVPASEATPVFEDFAERGFDIVEGATFDYGPIADQVAGDYPDTYFESSRVTTVGNRENVGYYYGKLHETRYLTGVASAMLSETNKLGYVLAFPISLLINDLNAMTLGAQTVNPDIEMIPTYTNTWYDPPTEQESARSLIEQDVDVLAYHESSPAVLRTANDADVWGIGYADEVGQFAGDNYMTSCMWSWAPMYEATARAARQGESQETVKFFGLEEGGVTLDEWGPQVPQEVKDEVATVREELVNGDRSIWEGSKFEGMSDLEIARSANEYVEGIQGSVPE